jgi:hypothetical protein
VLSVSDGVGPESANRVQHKTPVSNAVAVLFILTECSIAIKKYPITKMATINNSMDKGVYREPAAK